MELDPARLRSSRLIFGLPIVLVNAESRLQPGWKPGPAKARMEPGPAKAGTPVFTPHLYELHGRRRMPAMHPQNHGLFVYSFRIRWQGFESQAKKRGHRVTRIIDRSYAVSIRNRQRSHRFLSTGGDGTAYSCMKYSHSWSHSWPYSWTADPRCDAIHAPLRTSCH